MAAAPGRPVRADADPFLRPSTASGRSGGSILDPRVAAAVPGRSKSELSGVTARELARRLSGELEGEGERRLDGVAPVHSAGPNELTYLADRRLREELAESRPGAVIVPRGIEIDAGDAALIRVDGPELAFARATRILVPASEPEPGVHPAARVDEDAVLGEDVSVGPFAVVEADARVGAGGRIGAHSLVEAGARLGEACRIGHGCTVHGCARLGDGVVLRPGARVGTEGYGYVQDEEGRPTRVPHVGGCVVGDRVEIGANATVDRGSVEDTVIGAHTKIDNLVHVGHNVRVGRGCLIVAQVGLAGSVTVGDGVRIGGQAGVSDHLEIGAGARIAARAGVIGDVPAGEEYSGYPARPHRRALRARAAQLRLPELRETVRRLQEKVETLEAEEGE